MIQLWHHTLSSNSTLLHFDRGLLQKIQPLLSHSCILLIECDTQQCSLQPSTNPKTAYSLTLNCDNIIQNIIIRAKFRMVRASHPMKNRKIASIGVRSFVATVALDCSSSVVIRYKGNGLSRYDEKEYLESSSRIRREKNVRGPLKIGKYVTIKTKSHIWKAVVANTNPDAPPWLS